jgi:hypothetical protein
MQHVQHVSYDVPAADVSGAAAISARLLPRHSVASLPRPGRLLQSIRAETDSCTIIWTAADADQLANALKHNNCTSVELQLETSRKLMDTAQQPIEWPINVTISGKTQPDGSLPQLLVRANAFI